MTMIQERSSSLVASLQSLADSQKALADSRRALELSARPLERGNIVGAHVHVYWPEDDWYYPGQIIRQHANESPLKVTVRYDRECNEKKPHKVAYIDTLPKNHCKVTEHQKIKEAEVQKVYHRLVGQKSWSRIRLFWPVEHKYYEGFVTNVRTQPSLEFQVLYDDGDEVSESEQMLAKVQRLFDISTFIREANIRS